MTKTISILALLAGLSTAPAAFAGDGFYVSGAIQRTTQESHQSRNTESNMPNTGAAGGASGTVVDKNTDIGFVGGVGYKKNFKGDFFASLEGFYSTESVDTTTLNNVKVNHVELNATYGADLRLGTYVSDRVALYGLTSLTAHDFDSRLSYTFAPPVDNVSETEWGLVYGGGVEIKWNDKLASFAEVRIINDIEYDTPVDRGGVQAHEELNYTTIRSGFRFFF